MALLSISEAARRAGVDRSTIQRAIKTGRLSATRDSNGRRCIDAAELGRVYGAGPQETTGGREVQPQADMVALLRDQVALLRDQVAGLQEDKARLLGLMEREQDRADTYLHQVVELQNEMKLLTGPDTRTRPWWWWMLGR